MKYTSHGHLVIKDNVYSVRPPVARCGGPKICSVCSKEAVEILENYKNNQDGILYDLELAFPSKVVTQFDTLLEELESELNSNSQIRSQKYEDTKKIFFKYLDNSNSLRVVDKIKNLL